jgi:hypothetical protein
LATDALYFSEDDENEVEPPQPASGASSDDESAPEDLIHVDDDETLSSSGKSASEAEIEPVPPEPVPAKKKQPRRAATAPHIDSLPGLYYIVLDVETSASCRATGQIISMAAVVLDPNGILLRDISNRPHQFESFVGLEDGAQWSEESAKVHGIRKSSVQRESRFPLVWTNFQSFVFSIPGIPTSAKFALCSHNGMSCDFDFLWEHIVSRDYGDLPRPTLSNRIEYVWDTLTTCRQVRSNPYFRVFRDHGASLSTLYHDSDRSAAG